MPTSPEKPPLLVVVGPTASGKTELATRLCESQGGEIVTADSVQVYRGFDIGSGKPSRAERERVRHHLIDVVEPNEALDAARWAELAEASIADIRARGKVPIVCGGTFLWVRALIYGLAAAPPASAEIRARHRELAERDGRAALHAELARVDAEAAARLAPNDFVRVSRALEVFELTQVPISRWHAEHGFREKRHEARLIGVRREKSELDALIEKRVTNMLDAGWVDEVAELIRAGHGESRAMGAVGYKQIKEALALGHIDREALAQGIVRVTRVFARRQRTWLRDEPVEYVAPAAALS
ncbi:MAG TPA: tRNA (adenosine(37)-N6)-dimethylallyltransferase MiaA [Polyangiaceae bacterium]|nr:tRNA (adenosine(37)-N6)-dimethylallyltransferase MiaA [Polyangiaceae bacterium]